MTGFDPIAILVESRADVDAWAQRMDGLGASTTSQYEPELSDGY